MAQTFFYIKAKKKKKSQTQKIAAHQSEEIF